MDFLFIFVSTKTNVMKSYSKKGMSRKFKNMSKKAQELGFVNVREAIKAGYENEMKNNYKNG